MNTMHVTRHRLTLHPNHKTLVLSITEILGHDLIGKLNRILDANRPPILHPMQARFDIILFEQLHETLSKVKLDTDFVSSRRAILIHAGTRGGSLREEWRIHFLFLADWGGFGRGRRARGGTCGASSVLRSARSIGIRARRSL